MKAEEYRETLSGYGKELDTMSASMCDMMQEFVRCNEDVLINLSSELMYRLIETSVMVSELRYRINESELRETS